MGSSAQGFRQTHILTQTLHVTDTGLLMSGSVTVNVRVSVYLNSSLSLPEEVRQKLLPRVPELFFSVSWEEKKPLVTVIS